MYCTHIWSPFIFFTCTLWSNRRATLDWPPGLGLDDDESFRGDGGSSKSTRAEDDMRAGASNERTQSTRRIIFGRAHTHTTILVLYVTNFWDTTEISNL